MLAGCSPEIAFRWGWQSMLLTICIILAPAGLAHATCTGIGCSCSITADPLDFGTYNPLGASNADAIGNVSVQCGALIAGVTISYEVTLGAGMSGAYTGRTLSSGTDTLTYNLYTDASRTTIWGNGSSGTGTITNGYLLQLLAPRVDDFPIYGRVPYGQNVEAGSYTDSIVATVIF